MQKVTPTLHLAGHTIESRSPRARTTHPISRSESSTSEKSDVIGQVNPFESSDMLFGEQSRNVFEEDNEELSEGENSSDSVSSEDEARAHAPSKGPENSGSEYAACEEKSNSNGHSCDERLRGLKSRGYECLDHTGDVTIHAKASTLKKALARAGLCLFDVISDVTKVEPQIMKTVSANGHDRESLVVNFLNELVALYGVHYFLGSRVKIVEFDDSKLTLTAQIQGEIFNASKHTSGTEVKAATLHEAAVWERKYDPQLSFCANYDMEDDVGTCYDIFVVLDV